MSKLTLGSIVSSFLSITKINDNFTKISKAFDNTLSRDGSSPNAMAASLDMNSERIINLGAPVNPSDAVRLQDLGSGGSVGVSWTSLTGKPSTFPPSAHTHVAADVTDLDAHFQAGTNITLTPVSGKLQITASGTLAADWNTLINKPSTFTPATHTHPESDTTGLVADLANKAALVHTHVYTDVTNFGTGVNAKLAAGSNVTLTYNSGTQTTTVSAAGSGASGQKPALLSTFGAIDGGGVNTSGNDTAFTGAEADPESDIYIPDGTYKTTKTTNFLTKRYVGRGTVVTADATPQQVPGNFSYLNAYPSTLAGVGTGVGGWFSGDQKFTTQEYKVIGPSLLTYDIANRTTYFQSNFLANSAFFDANSGNSGTQAFLTSGATAGATVITINAAPSSEWVGKTVGFGTTPDVVSETKTIASVGPGNTITLSAGLTNSYTWNPTTGLKPCIMFGHRSFSAHKYIKVNDNAGGDVYGHMVNITHKYVPKPSEYHPFMAGTAGQYGGNITFTTPGVYATGWESQYNDNGNDVMAIAQVDSFNRTKDDNLINYWGGTYFKTGGTRPADVAHNVLGLWRVGLDTVQASMWETAKLVDPTIASGSTIKVTSLNGAVVGMTISIGDAGQYSGTISAINTGASSVTVNPALPGTPIAAGTIVKYTRGGAVVNMALGQRMVWNSTVNVTNTGRGADPLGVFAPFYGNNQGDLEMGTETDGFGDYWYVRFNGNNPAHNSGAISRLRLRPNNLAYNLDFQCGGAVSAAAGLVTNGGGTLTTAPIVVFGAGSGNLIGFNVSLNRYEFFKNNSLVYTI